MGNVFGMIVGLSAAFLSVAATCFAGDIEHTPDKPKGLPEKIVVLNWSLAEQALELGVEPIAVADAGYYKFWVVNPPLPETTLDIGRRGEPNLEYIASLEPDLILAGDDQKLLLSKLELIAPTRYFKIYSEDHDNFERSKEIYRELAALFKKQDVAKTRLQDLDQRLSELAGQIRARFPQGPPPVTVIRFLDTKRVIVYGSNGMPEAALNALGIASGFELPGSRWGLAYKSVASLSKIESGLVMYIEPFAGADELFATEIWKNMPFVKDKRFVRLPPLWTYGGANSVRYTAEAITQALLEWKKP